MINNYCVYFSPEQGLSCFSLGTLPHSAFCHSFLAMQALTRTPMHLHITPNLKSLHWIKITE